MKAANADFLWGMFLYANGTVAFLIATYMSIDPGAAPFGAMAEGIFAGGAWIGAIWAARVSERSSAQSDIPPGTGRR